MTKSVYMMHTQRVQVAVVAMGFMLVGCFLLLRWTVLLCINITPRYLADVIPCSHTDVASERILQEMKTLANKQVSCSEGCES